MLVAPLALLVSVLMYASELCITDLLINQNPSLDHMDG